jgi:hypothetical protein
MATGKAVGIGRGEIINASELVAGSRTIAKKLPGFSEAER